MAAEPTTPTIMLFSILSSVQLSSVFRSERFTALVFYGMRLSLDCSMYFVHLKICILLQNFRAFVFGVMSLLLVFRKFLNIGILYSELILLFAIPMFMKVLSVPVEHENRNPAV